MSKKKYNKSDSQLRKWKRFAPKEKEDWDKMRREWQEGDSGTLKINLVKVYRPSKPTQ